MFKLVDNENNIASLSWTQWAAVATYANLAFCPSGLENENQVYIVSWWHVVCYLRSVAVCVCVCVYILSVMLNKMQLQVNDQKPLLLLEILKK